MAFSVDTRLLKYSIGTALSKTLQKTFMINYLLLNHEHRVTTQDNVRLLGSTTDSNIDVSIE